MKMVFAGTLDARKYVLELVEKGEKVLVSTYSEYAIQLYPKSENIILRYGPMTREEKKEITAKYNIDEIVDYTHPYAENISKSLKNFTKDMGIKYTRIDRNTSVDINNPLIKRFDDLKDIIEYLDKTTGNILLTIGSNRVGEFKDLTNLSRVTARILPSEEAIEKCIKAGFLPKQIIGMQGPFSYEFNKLIIEEKNIEYLVTKDSGKIGGTLQKVEAAIHMGIEVLLLNRPKG